MTLEDVKRIGNRQERAIAMTVFFLLQKHGKCTLKEMEERCPKQRQMMFSYFQWYISYKWCHGRYGKDGFEIYS